MGKTWLVKEFARRNYRQLAYVNFEEMKILRNLFEQDFDIPRILTAIGAVTGVTCSEGDTLIFLDEIQAAPHAVTSLKYFAENAPGYHVIAAGSLLGIELHRGESFPVGKVDFLTLHPMSFVEFVMAMGEENLSEVLMAGDWNMMAMLSPKFQELLRYYYFVGGMPEAVLSFSRNRDWKEVRALQNGDTQQLSEGYVEACPFRDCAAHRGLVEIASGTVEQGEQEVCVWSSERGGKGA